MTELSPENKIINGLWISPDGKPLSNLERLSIYSFCAHGHDFRLWTYGDFPNVPQDTAPGKVEVRDGNEIIPADKVFFARKSYGHFSDWFRWELLRQFGGIWADIDIVCLRPIDYADDFVLMRMVGDNLNSNFLKTPKGHFFAEALADASANPGRIVPWDNSKRRRWKRTRRLRFWKDAHQKHTAGETGGPQGITLAAEHFGLTDKAKPSWHMEAVSLLGFPYFVNSDLYDIGVLQPLMERAYGFHFPNSHFGVHNLDKNGTFHPNSPLEILKRRYLPELKEKP